MRQAPPPTYTTDKDIILLYDNNIRGALGSIMCDRFVNSDGKKRWYIDANKLYNWVLGQSLPYDEIKFDDYKLGADDNSDMFFFVEIDTDEIKQDPKKIPFAPEIKTTQQDIFSDYMIKLKTDTYATCKMLICHWSYKKRYLIHYRMLIFFC